MDSDGIYKMLKHYAKRVWVNIEGFGAHSLRATATTNALDHEADIALYDRRKTRPEDSPTFKGGIDNRIYLYIARLRTFHQNCLTVKHLK
jgi:hypothetical protein